MPVSLDATLEPIALLRDAARPYGTKLHLASGETSLTFDGTMKDPLDVDGADGRAALRVPTPEAILALAGASDAELDASLNLEAGSSTTAMSGACPRPAATWPGRR